MNTAGQAARAADLFVPVPRLPDAVELGRPVTVSFAFGAGEGTGEGAGTVVAEAFSTCAALVLACGPAQPWVRLTREEALRALRAAGAHVLVVDVGGPEADVVPLDEQAPA